MYTKIKMCGLRRPCDIQWANELKPDYIGFVFAEKSKRYVTPLQAAELKKLLDPQIQAVGVFVNEAPEKVASLLKDGVIDIAQLHGKETEEYIAQLRLLTKAPLIQAVSVASPEDIQRANRSSADYVLLDSGVGGTGTNFDWSLLSGMERPYFLAGGLSPEKVKEALTSCEPFAVDVSSGIETDGYKDREKMAQFMHNVLNA